MFLRFACNLQLLFYHQTNQSVTISTMFFDSSSCYVVVFLGGGCFCCVRACVRACVCVAAALKNNIKAKQNKSKDVSLINHWLCFVLLFQQLMTCNLYSESETGLKFDSMSRSPGYLLSTWHVKYQDSINLCIDKCLIIRFSYGEKCVSPWVLLMVACVLTIQMHDENLRMIFEDTLKWFLTPTPSLRPTTPSAPIF